MTEEQTAATESEDAALLADAAAELNAAAMNLADQGVTDLVDGAEDLSLAHDFAQSAAEEAMLGASDLTRAVDASIVADRLALLSDVVGVAGVNDIEQGADLIAASEDVDAVSAAVGLMTVDDLDKGLELGRLAGELNILGRIVGQLEMPVLSVVLDDRGERLAEIATDTILRAAATRSLTDLIDATGQRISDLGVNEIDEGVLRMAASDIAADRSADLDAAGFVLGVRGLAEMAMAAEDAGLADSLEELGVEEVATGAEKLGEAAVFGTEAAAFDEEANNA